MNCHYNQLEGKHQFIEEKHKEKCVEYPLVCPNNCKCGCIPHKDLKRHSSKCPLEVVCEYHTVVCEAEMTCGAQNDHNKEKMEYHLL